VNVQLLKILVKLNTKLQVADHLAAGPQPLSGGSKPLQLPQLQAQRAYTGKISSTVALTCSIAPLNCLCTHQY